MTPHTYSSRTSHRDSVAGRVLASVWVAFIAIPLYHAFTSSLPLARQIPLVTTLIAIAALFLYGSLALNIHNPQRVDDYGRRLTLTLVGLVVLSLVATVLSGEIEYLSCLCFYFGCLFYTAPLRLSLILGVSSDATILAVALLLSHSFLLWMAVYVFLWMVIAGLQRVVEDYSNTRAQIRQQTARNDERTRIAQDIHDHLGHSLTAINLKAQVLASTTTDPAATQAAQQIATLASQALAQVRATVAGLRDSSLSNQLEEMMTLLHDAGIHSRVNGSPEELPASFQPTAGWIAREAVTNILRHSCAREVCISVTPTRVIIDDDGVGLPAAGTADSGYGLSGMRRRAREVGAQVLIGPSPSGGTRVDLRFTHNAAPDAPETAPRQETTAPQLSALPTPHRAYAPSHHTERSPE